GFITVEIDAVEVLTDRARVIEPQARADRHAVAYSRRVAGKRGTRDETAPSVRGVVRDRLRWGAVVVDVSRSRRTDCRGMMLAFLDLHADLRLVIGTEEASPVVAEGRLTGRADNLHRAECGRSAGCDVCRQIEPARNCLIPGARIVRLRVDESTDTHVPQRI